MYAIEKEEEEKLFQRWLHFQHIPFDTFKGELLQHAGPVIKASADEALKKAKSILDNFSIERG